MDAPEYTIDLPDSTGTVLCLAARTLGVGSTGCGPRPLDQYIVWSEPATFSYVLRLLPAGKKICRRWAGSRRRRIASSRCSAGATSRGKSR